jgi:competence ComEA-like helix-hairpin-helix protein
MAGLKPRVWWFLSLAAICFALAAGAGAAKKPPLKPININTANSEELQQVPGIGPVTAEKILRMRKSYGAFKSVDDLLAIKGLGKKRLEKNAQVPHGEQGLSRQAASKEFTSARRRNRGSAPLVSFYASSFLLCPGVT